MNHASKYFKDNEAEAKRFKKYGQVLFRTAGIKETVLTIVTGTLETTQEAKFGDVIIRNFQVGTSAEQYIIGNMEKFERKYVRTDQTVFINGANWGVATPKGEVDAVEYSGDRFVFIAPWGEEMECKDGDFLCKPTDEGIEGVYRIERKAFDNTYKSK